MIPPKIVRFLEDYASVGFAGTRDRDLTPCGHRVPAWRTSADGRTLTAFVPGPFVDRMLTALRENGEFAGTFEEVSSHETYQLKGRYLSHRAVRADEAGIADRSRDRFAKGLGFAYEPNVVARLRRSIPDPAVAVDIEVSEVYLQTPGPGAGARLYPPQETSTSPERPDPRPIDSAPRAQSQHGVSLPENMRPVLGNGIPALMVTCSADGVPNVTIISQVSYVDPQHVALSFQFFSKTIRNVRENPKAFVGLSDFAQETDWVMDLTFLHSETSGPVFDTMDMQIEAIASATGMSGIFKLRAADIYHVVSVQRIPHPVMV